MDRGAGGQEGQGGHRGRGPLHGQAQRQGQEGQVVHQEPGKEADTNRCTALSKIRS